jgi:hypothetical protein
MCGVLVNVTVVQLLATILLGYCYGMYRDYEPCDIRIVLMDLMYLIYLIHCTYCTLHPRECQGGGGVSRYNIIGSSWEVNLTVSYSIFYRREGNNNHARCRERGNGRGKGKGFSLYLYNYIIPSRRTGTCFVQLDSPQGTPVACSLSPRGLSLGIRPARPTLIHAGGILPLPYVYCAVC